MSKNILATTTNNGKNVHNNQTIRKRVEWNLCCNEHKWEKRAKSERRSFEGASRRLRGWFKVQDAKDHLLDIDMLLGKITHRNNSSILTQTTIKNTDNFIQCSANSRRRGSMGECGTRFTKQISAIKNQMRSWQSFSKCAPNRWKSKGYILNWSLKKETIM